MSNMMEKIIHMSSIKDEDERNKQVVEFLNKLDHPVSQFMPITLINEYVYLHTYEIIHQSYGYTYFSSLPQSEETCIAFLNHFASTISMQELVREIKIDITENMRKIINRQKVVDYELYSDTWFSRHRV